MKNAGNAASASMLGMTKLSTMPPRRHAATIPTAMPRMNARRKPTPTRKIEYGSVRPITSETCDG